MKTEEWGKAAFCAPISINKSHNLHLTTKEENFLLWDRLLSPDQLSSVSAASVCSNNNNVAVIQEVFRDK